MPAHLEDHGAPGEPVLAQPRADPVGELAHVPAEADPVGDVDVEGGLRRHRLRRPLGDDLAVVDAAREGVQLGAVRLAEEGDRLVELERREPPDGAHTVRREPRRGRRPDAGDGAHRHRGEPLGLLTGRDDEQAVGLGEVGVDLRDELAGAGADRRGEPGRGVDAGAQALDEVGDRLDRRRPGGSG